MFLSVIIPVYNVEKYIGRCVESVVSQQLLNEIELLLVDDGSTDLSGQICDEYALKFPWIKVFHISNGGVGNARNYGLERATGDYITFIDSDDFLDDGIYALIYKLHQEHNSDAYVFGFKDYPFTKTAGCHKLNSSVCKTKNSLAETYLEMKKDFLMFPVYNKIFRNDICSGVRFNTEVHYFEDYLFALSCLNRVTTLCTIEMAAYNYVHHDGEHLGSKYTKPEIIVSVADQIKSLSFSLPQNADLKNYTILEYYNNLLHAVDSSKGFMQRFRYTEILVSAIKKYALLQEFREYLGRRKPLMTIPNVWGVLLMSYLRSVFLKLR